MSRQPMTQPKLYERSAPSELAANPASNRASLLADLFIKNNDALIRFLRTRLHSEQDAKDVAQEAYARLLEHRQPGAIKLLQAFLFKTAANQAIDRARHQSARRRIEPKLAIFEESALEPGPEQLAMRGQEARIALESLRELPVSHQQAFVLYRVHELSIGEVAAKLGVTERMVRYYIVRVMEHCRARIDADVSPRADSANERRLRSAGQCCP